MQFKFLFVWNSFGGSSCSHDSEQRGRPTADPERSAPDPGWHPVQVTAGQEESAEHHQRWRERILHKKCLCYPYSGCCHYRWVGILFILLFHLTQQFKVKMTFPLMPFYWELSWFKISEILSLPPFYPSSVETWKSPVLYQTINPVWPTALLKGGRMKRIEMNSPDERIENSDELRSLDFIGPLLPTPDPLPLTFECCAAGSKSSPPKLCTSAALGRITPWWTQLIDC